MSDEILTTLPNGAKRVALLRGTRGLGADRLCDRLENAGVSCVPVICAGEPSVARVNAAVGQLADQDVGALIAVGGGSVLDTGKAVAFCLGHRLTLRADFTEIPADVLGRPGPLPCVAVPTTAGTGAEVTANAVLEIPERGAKVSLRGRALFPSAALVDPGLLATAPHSVRLSSGLDAVVQTIEAYTSCAASPFSDALTAPNIPRGITALRQIMTGSPAEASWRDLAWVSLTSGVALANGGLGAAHGIASVLGGRYAAPHGALCGRLLAPVLRKNLDIAAPGTVAAEKLSACATHISAGFGRAPDGDALSDLEAWQADQSLPRLQDFGVSAEALPSLADASAAASSSKKNAVPLAPHDLLDILKEAF